MSEEALRKKAEFWLAMNVAGYTDKHIDCLVILLKEQDRDTRHACAEAVLDIKERHKVTINAVWQSYEEETVCLGLAHAAIMNCRGGINPCA